MTDNLPELPEPKRVYTFAGFNEWFTLDQIHSYALTAIATERARADALQAENAKLKTVMVAAAEEIAAHWDAHCDAEGYGPQNLMRRLEEGIPAEYGYTAGAFAELKSAALLGCGHHVSLMLKSAETGASLYCELCDDKSGRADAERMEQEYRARADALEAALSRLVLAIDAVGADDTGSEETLGEWHEARESARSLLEKTNGQDERAREICKGNAQTSGDDAEGTCRPSWP